MSSSAEIEYIFYDENDDEKIAVVTYFYTAGRAANTSHGHPDNYSPAEPSEIDIHQVEIDGRVLKPKEEKKFLEDHEESICNQIDEHESQEQEDYDDGL